MCIHVVALIFILCNDAIDIAVTMARKQQMFLYYSCIRIYSYANVIR